MCYFCAVEKISYIHFVNKTNCRFARICVNHILVMKDRILAVMEHEGLSPSQFADAIGIQRSAVAHFTSGRNNPSTPVLTKILEKFTHINPEWLLLGRGSMIRGDAPTQPDLFSSNQAIDSSNMLNASEYRTETKVETPVNTAEQPVKETIVIKERPPRIVSKIVIFYSDDTFETLIPEKHSVGKTT